MHLVEVTLRNWRSYRAADFRFPVPKGNRKVILVGAMNGYGKTSLLTALHLGLFGREAMPFLEGVKLGASDDERVRSYRQLMQRVLHRPALDGDDPHASVRLVFQKADEQIVVTRTWYFTRGGIPRDLNSADGEETRLEVNGRFVRHAGWGEANNRIASHLFPPHVMPCFFFDGEQAQERVEASGGRALYDAIHALFGTALLHELDESLRTYLSNQRQSVRRDHGDVREDELDRKRVERDQIEGQLAELLRELTVVRRDLDSANGARHEKFLELTQVSGDAMIDLEQLAAKKSDLQQQVQELQAQLCDDLAQLALPIVVRRWGRPLEAQLEAEIIRDRWLLLRDETVSKVDGIVRAALPDAGERSISPPLSESQRAQLDERMRKALEALEALEPATARLRGRVPADLPRRLRTNVDHPAAPGSDGRRRG
jgi:DNA sulfur modification protein DndD